MSDGGCGDGGWVGLVDCYCFAVVRLEGADLSGWRLGREAREGHFSCGVLLSDRVVFPREG